MMSSKHLRGDANYAWPTAEVAVMGAKVSGGSIHFRFLITTGHFPLAFVTFDSLYSSNNKLTHIQKVASV